MWEGLKAKNWVILEQKLSFHWVTILSFRSTEKRRSVDEKIDEGDDGAEKEEEEEEEAAVWKLGAFAWLVSLFVLAFLETYIIGGLCWCYEPAWVVFGIAQFFHFGILYSIMISFGDGPESDMADKILPIFTLISPLTDCRTGAAGVIGTTECSSATQQIFHTMNVK